MRTDSQANDPSCSISSAAALRGRRVHFIGIGGAGMSGLARVLLDAGAVVSGSDTTPNEQTIELSRHGARISYQQTGEQIDSGVALCVRTAAVRDGNPEYARATQLGIPTLKYAQLLGMVMRDRFGIAIAGTHGKSTTTSMTAFAMVDNGLDPSFVIGGGVPQLGGNSRSGRGEAFVVEACEYDRSFQQLWPRVAVVTNVEAEHLDVYRDLDEIIESFAEFVRRTPEPDGVMIGHGNDVNVARVARLAMRRLITFGLSDRDAFDYSVRPTEVVRGCHHGEVRCSGAAVAVLRPSIPGAHNLLNATCALAACVAGGLDASSAADSISRFLGVERRMSEVGRFNGAIVVDDYGHHPTEIRVTLDALRQKYQPRRLICVFQPHQYSRTRRLLEDFGTSFGDAELTIVPDIYAVRDSAEDRAAVSSSDLVERIQRSGRAALHMPGFPAVVDHLKTTARDGDVIVTMGAGNVYEVGKMLVA